MKTITSVDEYIELYPTKVQTILHALRKTIKEAAPDALETIAYGIPTYKLNGNLVHFGAFKKHIGFYPSPHGIEAFTEELAPYCGGKGTVQFPLDRPIPYQLISKIVTFRVKENLEKKK